MRLLLERVRTQTEIQRGRRNLMAVIASTDEPKRATEKEAVEAWSRTAANRLRSREMMSTEEESLPVQIARLHRTRTQNQSKSRWAPLTQAFETKNSDKTSGSAAALSQLLDSVKLRNLAVSMQQNPGAHKIIVPREEGLESLPLSKLILYRKEEAQKSWSTHLDEAGSKDQLESALTRMRPDDPGVLQHLLHSSRMLRERVSQL